MGQKTNPIIFRLGNIKEWDSKYIEKKKYDKAIYDLRNLKLIKFINKFFENYRLPIATSKLLYDENKIHIFIAYYLPKQIFIKKRLNTRLIAKKKINTNLKSFKFVTNVRNKKYFIKNKSNLSSIKKNNYKLDILKASIEQKIQFRRMQMIKNNVLTRNFLSENKILVELLHSLSLFTGKKQKNIVLTVKQLNKNFDKTITKNNLKLIKRIPTHLRKYQHNEFFNEGLNILLHALRNKKGAAYLLSTFVSKELGKLKRHAMFIRFLKTNLSLIIKKKLAKVSGIKIQIKGRINGVPRSKTRRLDIGNVVKKFLVHSDLHYSETTAFTKNGTFGVKVWIN